MVKLWSKNGKLISSDDKSKLIECAQCPCDSIAIELDCPSSLHTLGEGKPFSITATYAAPSASSVLPHIEITYDCVPADTNVSIMLESGGVLDFTTGWTGTLGTDKVLTFDAGNIMAVGTIMESSGTDRTCNATITAWDPNRVDTNGDPIEPVTCIISLWDDVNCTITAPSSECDGKEFSASLTTSGTGAAGLLVRMDSDNGIFSDPQTRFDLYLNGIDINSGGTSKWTKGIWEGTKLSNSSADPMEISFEEYGVELCLEEITVKKCGISSITVTCPGCLHTLGAGDTLTIVVVYDDIAGWNGKPDVSVTPHINAIIDEDTMSPPDFSSHWETSDDTRTWTRSIRPNASYLSGTSRSASVTFAVGSDKYVDGNGDRLADVTCTTYISDVVTCDGVTLTPMSDNPCTGGHLNIQITLKGDCGGAEGAEDAELTYINHPPSGLFGTWPPFRFEFDITGDYEMVEDNGWVNGVYDSLIKMTGVKDELGVIEDIEVTVSEYGEELCYGKFTPVPCEVEATITCPESLHTLGPSKWLTITLTYTDAEYYAPLLEIELYQGTSSYTAAAIRLVMEDELGGTDVATFGLGEWWLEGNVRTWRHKVQINSMPAEWEDGDAISIRVIMDYEDNSGNEVTGDECSIALHYKVECDGEAILPGSGCVNGTQDATITVKGTNGDDLVRMDYDENSGLFGSNLQFYRFKVAISGGGTQPLTPEGYSIHKNWVQGVWSCLESLGGGITPNSYIGDPVHITFEDAANTPNLVCEAEMTVKECGCTAEIDCPGNLHVYGDAKTLTIILTYTDPDLNDTHPNFYIEMAAVGDPVETLRDADGPISLADGPDWTWVDNSKIWQKEIHITGVAHTSGTTTVTIRATHINSLGIEEDLDTCPITISERISCSISGLPSDSCVDADDGKKDVGFSISVSGDPSETLTEWDPSPGGRFIITTSLPLPEGTSLYSGWTTDGSWSISGIEAGPGEHYVTLYDDSYPDDGCSEEFTLYDCTMTATISGCPVTIHSLGDGAELTITVTYTSYAFYHPDATVSLTGDAATWSAGSWVADAETGKKTMVGTLTGVINAEGTVTLEVKDPDGALLANCVVSVINTVTCSGSGVVFDPEQACLTTEDLPVTVGVAITIEGTDGFALTRMDGDADGRFEVTYTGLVGLVTGESWSGGVYTATMPSEASVTVALVDNVASATLCYALYEAADCSMTGALSCPTILHTLGEAKDISITATYSDPTLYDTVPTIEIYCPGDSATPSSACVTMTGSWGAVDEFNTRTYTGTIAATCIPEGLGLTSDIKVMLLNSRTLDTLDTCWIDTTSATSCEVTVSPDPVYINEEFAITVTISPVGYLGALPYIDERGSFEVVITGAYSGGSGCSMTSGWSDTGVWTCGGLTSEAELILVDVYRNGGLECSLDIPIEDPTPSVTFGCPESLHTLGAAKLLTLTYTINHPDYIPYFEVSSPLLLDDGTETAVNLESNWTLIGDLTYQWQRDVYVDEVPGGGHTGTITISAYYDPVSGDPVPIGTPCSIDISDEVSCSITAPEKVCVEEEFTVSVSITDINGDPLPRLDSSYFGTRFTFGMDAGITRPAGCALHSGWSNGEWSCSGCTGSEVGATLNIELQDRAAVICSDAVTISPEVSTLEYTTDGRVLHIYGESVNLNIVLLDSCLAADVSDFTLAVTFTVNGAAATISDYLTYSDGTAISFAASQWSNGVWNHSIMAKTSVSFASGIYNQPAVFTIEATPNYDGAETLSISPNFSISRDCSGTIEFVPTRTYPDAEFDFTLTLTDAEGKSLDRFPSTLPDTLTLTHGPEDTASAAVMTVAGYDPAFAFTEGVCTVTGAAVDEECIYFIEIKHTDSTDGSSVVYETISITDLNIDLSDLIEAINERREFDAWTPISTSTTNLTTVRNGILYNRYSATPPDAEGTLTVASENPVPTPPVYPSGGTTEQMQQYEADVQAWIESAYEYVCSLQWVKPRWWRSAVGQWVYGRVNYNSPYQYYQYTPTSINAIHFTTTRDRPDLCLAAGAIPGWVFHSLCCFLETPDVTWNRL